MPTPYSRLNEPANKPYAIGKRRDRHIPMMPLMSGQAAVDSLIGYYPSAHKMDSELNPHDYQKPNHVRSTTMPSTKTAQLYANAKQAYAKHVVDTVDPTQSEFVAGFLVKCASLSADQLLTVVQDAMVMHPAVCDEFEKCGFVKQAVDSATLGSSTRLPAPAFRPNMTSQTGKVSPRIPTTTSRKSGPGFLSNLWDETTHYPGNAYRNMTNWLGGGARTLGGTGYRATAGAGQLVGRATDGMGLTEGWTEGADTMAADANNYTMGALNNTVAGVTNRSAQATADSFNQMGATRHDGSAIKTYGDTQQDRLQVLRDMPEGQTVPFTNLSGRDAAGYANVADTTADDALISAVGGKALKLVGAPLSVQAVPGTLAGLNNPLTTAAYASYPKRNQTAPIDYKGNLKNTNEFLMGSDGDTLEYKPDGSVGEINPSGTPYHRTGEDGRMHVQMTDGTERLMDEHGQLQSPNSATLRPEVTQTTSPAVQQLIGDQSKYDNLVQQDPEAAASMMGQAEQTVSTHATSEAGAAQIANAQQTGDVDLTPEQQATAEAELTKTMPDGTPPEGIWEQFNQMEWPEKLGLGLGLGAGVMGLVQAMTGGGIGSWLMGLLGMGGAAMLAGNAGMLGQDAQGVTQGLTDTVTNGLSGLLGSATDGISGLFGPGESGEQTPPASLGSIAGFDITPDRIESVLPLASQLSDSVKVPMMQKFLAAKPEIAEKLKQATGNGSLLNTAKSWIGDVFGETGRQLDAYGIKGDKNQQEFLRVVNLAQQQQ